MERPYDRELGKLSLSQLKVLKVLLLNPERILTTGEIARRSGIIEKGLGGVLSAMSRKRLDEEALILPMGRDEKRNLRWRVSSRAITPVLALRQVTALLLSYK